MLARHPAVRDGRRRARSVDVAGETRLVAYVVPRAGLETAAGELRRFLAAVLPEPMVPSAFVTLASLPLTPNGKLDRRALPAPERTGSSGAELFVAPRDEVEAALARIFEEALGVTRVGACDDFFALGGHSLLAVRVMAAVQRRFERELPLVTLFREPTVERLAARLRESRRGPTSPLVCLRQGRGAPLFLVHAAGGTVAGYHALAARLPDRAVYGLQAAGLEGECEPESDLAAMAARYVAAVRAARPAGPIHLAGWSLGGVIAFEMARQILAAGGELGVLALLDTTAPGRSRWSDPRHLAELELEHMALPGVHPEALSAEERRRLTAVLRANLQAAHGAPPRSARVPILLLRARDESAGSERDDALGWSALTTGRPSSAPCRDPREHAEPPAVDVLAEELERRLDEVSARSRNPMATTR